MTGAAAGRANARAAAIARRLVTARWRVTMAGEHHLPAGGPVIVAGNHSGWLDGPLMAIMSPRPLQAMTKIEMFRGPMARFLALAGQIPLDRHHVDRAAIRYATAVLADGGVVGIFPEGTRGDGEMRYARGGAAYLALVTGAPVVPLAFLGTRLPGGANSSLPPRGGRIHLEYGAPITIEPVAWPRTRARVAAETERIRVTLRDLVHTSAAATGIALPGPLRNLEEN